MWTGWPRELSSLQERLDVNNQFSFIPPDYCYLLKNEEDGESWGDLEDEEDEKIDWDGIGDDEFKLGG